MRKRTHKLGGLGDVDAVVSASRSLNEAAAKLGVNRSTLHRWIADGKVAGPGPKRGAPGSREKPRRDQTPDEWADEIRSKYTLGETDLQLLELAKIALTAGRDTGLKSKERMTAIGRFQLVVRQLNLPEESAAKPESQVPPARAAVKPAVRVDPRLGMLRAVK